MFAGLFPSVIALVLVTAGPVWGEIKEFIRALPGMWEELQESVVPSLSGAAELRRQGPRMADEPRRELPEAASTLLGAAGGVFGSVLSLVTLTFLSLFLLMERPTVTQWLFGFTRPDTERRWSPVLEESIRNVSSSLIGNIAISVVAAVVAGFSAYVLGLPFPIVLAVITGLLDLIPQIGATIAAMILVAVALTVGTTEAVIMLVIQLIYQQVENYIVYPIVYKRQVELSPFTTIVAVLIAGSLLGVVGAILAMPFAAVIKTVIREATAPRRARMEALRAEELREQVPA